jgi:NAD(P)-dependent dehydrogenase (short-subunit alcohol dehydrogenase family)
MSSPSLFSLNGAVAVVTGGCGKLGSQYVATLADAGARVVALDKVEREQPLLSPYRANGTVTVVVCDITNKQEVDRAYASIVQTVGTPSILINNAGIDVPPDADSRETGPFEEYPETSWDAIIDSHLKGAFLMSQAFIRAYKAGRLSAGSIINVSSTYGVVTPDQSLYQYRRDRGEVFFKPVAYSTAKSGMLNFTRWLAEYGAPLGIRANTLVPGGVYAGQEEAFVKEYSRRTPLGRMARPDEYNGAVLLLASPASSYMTGATLVVDGGWTAR